MSFLDEQARSAACIYAAFAGLPFRLAGACPLPRFHDDQRAQGLLGRKLWGSLYGFKEELSALTIWLFVFSGTPKTWMFGLVVNLK